jgi:hypothetical protein
VDADLLVVNAFASDSGIQCTYPVADLPMDGAGNHTTQVMPRVVIDEIRARGFVPDTLYVGIANSVDSGTFFPSKGTGTQMAGTLFRVEPTILPFADDGP